MNIKLNDIALYVEVARRKNFSRAAEALNIPASTLSRRVGELERSVGMRLLNRSTRRIELTDAGALYYQRCRGLIEEARVAHEQLIDMNRSPKGLLRISLPNSLAQLFLPAVMEEFSEKYPDIECDFDMSSEAIDPVSNQFDLALRFGQQPDSDLVSRKILMMPRELYASPRYLARRGTPRTPADLASHECLRNSHTDDRSVWELRNGSQVERVVVSGKMAASHSGVQARLAASGLGIAPVPVFDMMRQAVKSAGLVPVLPGWSLAPVPLYALLPTQTIPAKTRAFLSFIEPRLIGGMRLN
ncbi:LysR family transcriptional regulator [Bordetella genomosp. 9]|uniref:LysR family transcriptional regulator n=1 Tax=Bordetella genomosp. 9 TaxID=1416803 RepID=A0A1W6Z5L1_9BORD|nr:LysR family transcriptional regulator [Bordetella genomosp. 9]ARP88652.1 LysR family transcriptional regulator [Bordetella genomosp. 9]